MISNEIKKQLNRYYKYLLNFLAAKFKHVKKMITFESYSGRQYSDNPRFISEKMHELFPDYKLVWGFQRETDIPSLHLPDYITAYPIDSWKYRQERASSFAFVRNEAMTGDLYKNKGQLYIQTWHGDRGFKKILYDSLEARGVDAQSFAYRDQKLTDLFVIGSDYAERRIKTAFRYNGETLKTGCPRNDCLVKPEKTSAALDNIGIPKGKKVLLYAPTLRRNRKIVHATVDIDETLRHLNQRGGDWVCLVRAHPKSLGLQVDSNSSIIDVSAYPDMADLLMIADCLITDYSSCAGDYVLRHKPLFLAQFDLEQYMEEDRTFYVDINEIGYLIAKTQEELNSFIDTMSDDEFADNCQKVLDYFGACETGHAAEDVCRWIDRHFQSMKG